MRRTKLPWVGATALASALSLAACSSGTSKPSAASTPTTPAPAATEAPAPTTTTAAAAGTTTAAPGGATVSVASAKVGEILVDSKGMTLYVWNNDKTAGKSSCTGACATAWPPLRATGTPTYGSGLVPSMFSTITRDDGSTQLAVNGKPLYLWQGDKSPGDTTGQGVNGFYVVGKDGKKIDTD